MKAQNETSGGAATRAAAPLLQTHELHTGYHQGGKRIIVSSGLPSLTIDAGQMICLLGPNGSGKSTILRILTGYLHPTSGTARVAGHDRPRAGSLLRLSVVGEALAYPAGPVPAEVVLSPTTG